MNQVRVLPQDTTWTCRLPPRKPPLLFTVNIPRGPASAYPLNPAARSFCSHKNTGSKGVLALHAQFPLCGMPPPPILQVQVPGSHALGSLLALILHEIMTLALLPHRIAQTTSVGAFLGLHCVIPFCASVSPMGSGAPGGSWLCFICLSGTQPSSWSVVVPVKNVAE